MCVRNIHKIRPKMISVGLLLWAVFMLKVEGANAFDLRDAAEIGAAYTTHLFLHELGHQVVADEVDADSHQMKFFTVKDGRFYPGLSLYKDIPEESKLPYAAGGDRMASCTFEFALESYRRKPTTFNQSLMFFSCIDFLVYTLLANYIHPDDKMYDPNLIRSSTGCSKELLLSLVAAKSLMNGYRIMHPDANFAPMIWLDEESAAFLVAFKFQ